MEVRSDEEVPVPLFFQGKVVRRKGIGDKRALVPAALSETACPRGEGVERGKRHLTGAQRDSFHDPNKGLPLRSTSSSPIGLFS